MFKKYISGILPLMAFPVYNLIFAKNYTISLHSILFMLCISFAEEIFFRGLLLKTLIAKQKKYPVFISAVIFALCHIVNITHESLLFTLMQVISAFSVGMAYGYITIRSNSIIPAVTIHFMTNLTGLMNDSSMDTHKIIGLILCILIYIAYAMKERFNSEE